MGGPTLAGVLTLGIPSSSKPPPGRRPEEAKLSLLCLPIAHWPAIQATLSGRVETVALSKAPREGQLPVDCSFSLSEWRVLCFERASA